MPFRIHWNTQLRKMWVFSIL